MRTEERNDREDRKPRRVNECPWCGCKRSSSQAFDGYCDEHCRASYENYSQAYMPEVFERKRRR